MRQRGKQKFHTIRDMCHHVHHRRDRQAVKAILFDEIRTDQVLTFRELFQANQYLQQLGSSVCNLYTYSVWVYHIAMILCTNNFDLNNKSVSEADRSWLKKNAIVVQLPTPACSAAAWHCNAWVQFGGARVQFGGAASHARHTSLWAALRPCRRTRPWGRSMLPQQLPMLL